MNYPIFILMIVAMVAPIYAQDSIDPMEHLDSPIAEFQADAIKIHIHRSLTNLLREDAFGSFLDGSVGTLLSYLFDLQKHPFFYNEDTTGQDGEAEMYQNSGYLSGNFNQLKQDLGNYVNNFPASSEVFNMALSQPGQSYVNAVGQFITVNDESAFEGLESSGNTEQIVFFAGRNTSVNNSGYSAYATSVATVTVNNHTYELSAYGLATPIILDMDGDGQLQASNGQWLPHALAKDAKMVEFDINGDGFDELIEWVGANDGILISGSTTAINGNNMFGNAGGFYCGYEKLSTLDKNGDIQLTGKELEGLSVWQDKNGDAKVDAGEVSSVSSLGITAIGIHNKGLTSTFVQNEQTKTTWDWHPVAMSVKKTRK